MSLVRIAGAPILFPTVQVGGLSSSLNRVNNTVNDAVGENTILFGRVFIDGAPTGTKTISAAGGGSIYLLTGSSITWANAGTNMRVGIQDIDTVNGPPIRGDGTFDVYADWVPGTNTLSASTFTQFPMSSGTKSLAHGDAIAIVSEITAIGGADSVTMSGIGATAAFPGTSNTISGTVSGVTNCPVVLIVFDDGTLATLEETSPVSAMATEAYQDSTNPDERGLVFQVPFSCKVCGFWFPLIIASAAADFQIDLYSDPLGTPASMLGGPISFLGENRPATSAAQSWYRYIVPSGSEVTLSINTDYCLAIKATGTANITTYNPTYANASYRFAISNGTTLRKGTRNNSTGAFSETTTIIPMMGVLISHLDNGAGGGGGGTVAYTFA